jgi:redox-sensitive bicupin YhaK (pirin superfamily)
MPAVTVENPLVLPRVPRPEPTQTADRPVERVLQSHRQIEGVEVDVWRPLPGEVTYVMDGEAPGAQLRVPWSPHFSAMVYVLSGQGVAGPQQRLIRDHQPVEFGPGDNIVLRAADRMSDGWDALDVLVLGGLRIREPIAHYAPFVMNTRDEITQAMTDYQAGRLGVIPADQMAPPKYS